MLTGEREQQPGCCAVLFKPELQTQNSSASPFSPSNDINVLQKTKSEVFFTVRSLGGVVDPQKSPKPEPWEMASFLGELLCSEGSELGLCAGNELPRKNCLVQIFPMQTQHLPQSCCRVPWVLGSAGAVQSAQGCARGHS